MSTTAQRLIGWTGLCLAAWAELGWLLWTYVPAHAARFGEVGMELPLATRVAVAGSLWFVRVLPFAVVSCVVGWPFIASGIALLAVLCGRWKPLLSIVIGAIMAMSLAGLVGSAIVIISIEMAG